MSDTLQILKATRDLITLPEHWTKGASARDAAGGSVSPLSDDALCFCIYGALDRASAGKVKLASEAIFTLRKVNEILWLADFNDEHSHSEVLTIFDKAIASIENSEVDA